MTENTGKQTISRAKRWRRFRRRLSYAIAIVATLIIVVFVFTRTRLLSYQVERYVNDHYFAGTPFEFTSGRISGDLLHRVVIEDPELRYDSQSASFAVFRADEVAVEYKVLEVMKFNFVAENIRLKNVRLQLRADEEGGLVIPTLGGTAPEQERSPVSPRVDIQNFDVEGLSLRFGGGGRELTATDVNVRGAYRYRDGQGRLMIVEGNAVLADPHTGIQSLTLDVTHRGEDISVREFLLRLDQSLVRASGNYRDGRLDHVNVVFNPVSLDELSALGLVGDVSGEFGGNAVLNGSLDSLEVNGTITGAGVGVALTGLEFEGVVAGGYADMSRIEGLVFGARGKGRLRFPTSGPTDIFFEGTVANLDLTQGFLPDKGVPVTNLNGYARLDHKAVAGTYDVVATLEKSSVDGYEFMGGSFSGLWTDGVGMEVRSVVLERPGYRMEGFGQVADEGGVFDMVMQARGHDLTYFWDYFELPHTDGNITATARLQGPPEDMQINLNGDVTDVRFLFAAIDTGTVQAELTGVGSPTPRVRLDVSGRRGFIEDFAVSGPHLYLEVDEGPAQIRSLTFARGDTSFSGSFQVDEREDGVTEVRVHRAAVRDPFETWTLQRAAMVYVDSNDVRVDSLVFASPSGQVGGGGTYSQTTRQCDLRAWGRHGQLVVLEHMLALPFQVSGTADFELSVRGDIDNPLVSLSAQASEGVVDSVSFDRLDVAGRFDGGVYRLDHLELESGGDSLAVDGRWDYPVSPWNAAREGIPPEAFDRDLALDVRAWHYPVAEVLRALHLPLWVGGAYTGSVEIRGTPRHPVMVARGRLDPRPGPGLRLPPTEVDMAYADEVLEVRRLHTGGDFRATASGTVPMRLSMAEAFELFQDRPMSARATLPAGSLAPLRRYIPGVDQLDGGVAGEMTLTGTPGTPKLSGRIDITNGSVELTGMEEQYRGVTARLDLLGSTLRLTSLTARTGKEGTASASGLIELDGLRWRRYEATIDLRDFRLVSIPDFESLQDGTLRVRSINWRDGRMIPDITGKLDVKEVEMIWEFAQTTPTARATILMPTATPGWVCSIDLEADNNVWIRNPDLNVEVSGTGILVRDEQGLYLRGDLEVIRGSYNVYGNKFHITDGTLNFSTAETLRPEMHINAYTPYRNEGGIEKRILLSLDWPQDKKEPTLSLSYDDPGYYESDLWRMLGGTQLASGIAANALERALNQQMSGLTVEVEQRQALSTQTGSSPEQEMMIGVGKYLWEDFYLRFRQGLTVSSEQAIQVEYRMSKLVLLRSEFIRNSRRSALGYNSQYTDEFNLDIKFRWEY